MKKRLASDDDEEEAPQEVKVSKVAIEQGFLTKRTKNKTKRRKKETRKALQRMKLLTPIEAVPSELLEKLKEGEGKIEEEEEAKPEGRKKQSVKLVDTRGRKFALLEKKKERGVFDPQPRTSEEMRAFKEEMFNSVERVKFRLN